MEWRRQLQKLQSPLPNCIQPAFCSVPFRPISSRAFDLLEFDGKNLRREPLERRRVLLMRLLAEVSVGLQVNDHIAAAGDVVFRHACQLGLEGIVSKRIGSPYISGRSRTWLKFKDPDAPAVKRKTEEDWGRER